MSETVYNEQELIRRDSLKELKELGINPYPQAEFKVSTNSKDIKDNFEKSPEKFTEVSFAGRIMAKRIMGNASFLQLQDHRGKLQIYVRKGDLTHDNEENVFYNSVIKKILDIGDIIGVQGFVFTTKMGEISIHATSVTLLCKSLRPLPIVKEKDGETFDAVSDLELRYRQRYVDLIINPQIKDVFIKRSKIVSTMREFFNTAGYLEVDTPVLQPIPGGAAARPFTTHHNSLDIPLYLRIANELYLKRLIVGGFDGVYEFSRNFRNEGMDRTHNPEFTVMEIYVAYKDYIWMMKFVEEMLSRVAQALHGKTVVTLTDNQGDREIEFGGEYIKMTMREAILKYAYVDIKGKNEEELVAICKELGVPIEKSMGKGKLIDAIFGEKCEEHLIQPTFITDYPIEMSPLCKRHRDDDELTERFELFVNGKELCNAYSELNDPIDQLERFQDQVELAKKGDDEAMFIDMDFVRSLEYGMPTCSGMGIGIDRLTMFMTNQSSIQDVLFFPQMRPEKV